MTHARGAVSHTIKLPRSQRAEGHDCLELKGREKRRQYVGATAQLLARRSAIAEPPPAVCQNARPTKNDLSGGQRAVRPKDLIERDGMLCRMLGITHSDLIERLRSGGTDEEILEWCYAQGTRLNRAQVHIWNEFARKPGNVIKNEGATISLRIYIVAMNMTYFF